MAGSGFWDNQDQAREVIVESNRLKSWVDPWKELDEKSAELVELGTLLEVESDDDLEAEWLAEIGEVERRSEALEVRTMLQGSDDHRGALLTVHPGAGGLESQDWAEMLTRMYMRWSERHGYSVNVLDLQPAEEAGIKSATLEVSGDDAYGYLKAEKGVHRLVRISPFDAQSRRHTSFASVFVYPEVDDTIEIEIDDSDLRVDTFRSSGPGGQSVNKTSSAIRITHLPTDLVVQCQDEKSQHKNKSKALRMLRSRLMDIEAQNRKAEEDATRRSMIGSGDRSERVRTYNWPQNRVTDHRLKESYSLERILLGQLDDVVAELRERDLEEKITALGEGAS